MAEDNKWLRRFRELKAAQEARRAGALPAQPAYDMPTPPTAPQAKPTEPNDVEVCRRAEAMLRFVSTVSSGDALPVPPPANCTEPQAHGRSGHLWHNVAGLGWYCIAWACLQEVKKR